MKPDKVATYALSFAEVTEEQPFGPDVDVYKVVGKVFAIISPDLDPPIVSLKCEPELAIALRQEHPAITAGYHLNKKHWNTVVLDGSITPAEIKEMVAHSYERVTANFPRTVRDRLAIANAARSGR